MIEKDPWDDKFFINARQNGTDCYLFASDDSYNICSEGKETSKLWTFERVQNSESYFIKSAFLENHVLTQNDEGSILTELRASVTDGETLDKQKWVLNERFRVSTDWQIIDILSNEGNKILDF